MIQRRCSSITWFLIFGVVRVITALLVPLFIAVAHIHAETPAKMNTSARSGFVRADADLNKTYQAVLAKLPTTEKQKLQETQRTWIAFRDAEAAHAAQEAESGSMAPTFRYEKIVMFWSDVRQVRLPA